MINTAGQPMSGLMRWVLVITAVLLTATGGFGLWVIVQLLMIETADSVYVITGQKEILFRLLWALVALCFVATGLSLLVAAVRQRRNNMVPGPTLYVLGSTLVIIALFLLSDAELVAGTVIGLAGVVTMRLEYRSAHI